LDKDWKLFCDFLFLTNYSLWSTLLKEFAFFVLDIAKADICSVVLVADDESGLQISKYGLIQKIWAKISVFEPHKG